jgi:hypothetical protein
MAATATRSIRISADLFDQAASEAVLRCRSTTAQLEYWARIGQAVEGSPGRTLDRLHAALDGHLSADVLEPDEREFFDDQLGEAFDTPSAQAQAFFANHRQRGGGVGYDDEGRLVRGLPPKFRSSLQKTA